MYFCRKGRSVLFRTKGTLCISIDCYNTAGSGHLKLEIGIVWHRIKSSERSPSEQCMIAAAKGDDIEDEFFTMEVVRRSEDNLQRDWARTTGLYAGDDSFKGILCGLDP